MTSYARVTGQIIALLTIATSILGAIRATEDKSLSFHLSIERAGAHTPAITAQTTVRHKSSQ
jgi:hypothetical protein